MHFETSSKVRKNLSSGFLTWSPHPGPNTRPHHSQCECTEEPQDPGSLHAAPQPYTRRSFLKILKPCSPTCLIISFTNSATPPPSSPLSAAIGRKELGYSSTYNWDWLSRKCWIFQAQRLGILCTRTSSNAVCTVAPLLSGGTFHASTQTPCDQRSVPAGPPKQYQWTMNTSPEALKSPAAPN